MTGIRLPGWLREQLALPADVADWPDSERKAVRQRLSRFRDVAEPQASIVIPAYNEEASLGRTLVSLSRLRLSFPTEILVVNNNASDRTQEVIDGLGVRSVFEPEQGTRFARQTGLVQARGRVILHADADSLYPPDWGARYVKYLEDNETILVYGAHALIPTPGNPRLMLWIHESLAGVVRQLRQRHWEYINVLGANSAFRRADGLQRGSYEHTPTGAEDGHMALTLMRYGRLRYAPENDCRVWTSDRRLMHDGGLLRALVKRLWKHTLLLPEYLSAVPRRRGDRVRGPGEVHDEDGRPPGNDPW